MRSRVIIKNHKYAPQIKYYWWSGWEDIYCQGNSVGVETLIEAIEIINTTYKQKREGQIVWKDYL